MTDSEAGGLRMAGVWAGYGATTVLEDVALDLAVGEAAAVIGRNGVGKTTLLETLIGHTRMDRGSIRLGERVLDDLPAHRRAVAGIGYVPQEREIFPSLSVLENLTVAARPGRWSLERIFDLFPRLAERRSSGGGQLSGGEQQMLAIARALMTNPCLLLMDEPSEGLAPVIVEDLARVFARLRREESMTMLLVEQKTGFAFAFAERAVVMNRGRIVYDGPSRRLAEDREALAALVGVRGGDEHVA